MAFLQTALILGLLSVGNVYQQAEENAMVMLDERTQNKQQNLQQAMNVDWSYLTSTDENALKIIHNTLQTEHKTYPDIASDAALNNAISKALAPELISRIRSNHVSGAFFVLWGRGDNKKPENFAGVYLRDLEPGEDTADNSDLTLLRGPAVIAAMQGISLSDNWQECFTFPGGAQTDQNDYFFQPLLAVRAGKITKGEHNGYWAAPFSLNNSDAEKIITYTEPLTDGEGNVYGVAGIEVSVDMITDFLSMGEFARSGRGCYFFGITQDGGKTYQKITTGGPKYLQFFNAEEQWLTPVNAAGTGRLSVRSTQNEQTLRGSVLSLSLYPDNSVYSESQWALIGMTDENTLFAFPRHIRNLVSVAAALTFVLGAAMSIRTGRNTVKPIIQLADSLKQSDPGNSLQLEYTGIVEIDQLAEVITHLNQSTVEASTKLSKILRMAGLSVGVFEIRNDRNMAYCSDDVYTLLDRFDVAEHGNLIPKTECIAMVEKAMEDEVEESVFRVHGGLTERCVSIRRTEDQQGVIGTILDVTADIENRRRIEHDRDYDLLTGILNRRAFENSAEVVFTDEVQKSGVAAVMMMDLDKLKYLNDNYGHDYGDQYIRAFAEKLSRLSLENTLVARRSGDEFLALLYHADGPEPIRRRIDRAWEEIRSATIALPDGSAYPIQASAGIAWYPKDAQDLNKLTQYADFAMYRSKRNARGTVVEFQSEDYEAYLRLVENKAALERLMNRGLIRFEPKPIFSAHTCIPEGYWLSACSDEPELPDLQTIADLAETDGKMSALEKLFWNVAMETVRTLARKRSIAKNAMFFLEPIRGKMPEDMEQHMLAKRYQSVLPHVVLALGKENSGKYPLREHGCRIAAECDFEAPLVNDADFLLLTPKQVTGIETDDEKRQAIQELVKHAEKCGRDVLALNVENEKTMCALVVCGVAYLQGNLLNTLQKMQKTKEMNATAECEKTRTDKRQ